MEKFKAAILLLCVFAVSCTRLVLKVEARASLPLEIDIEAMLKLLNKPAVKTIKSKDGDIIDCININRQPAFDHPALKNHTIQRIPKFLLESQNSSTRDTSQSKPVVFQTWHKSGSCPKGTVPIRRILKKDLLRAASLDRFGRKPVELFMNSTNFVSPKPNGILDRSAALLMATGSNYIGAEADINVWNPKVELPGDFTTAQIWVKARNGIDFESIEAGWVVNPELYGDTATRFFAYWTKDSYRSTGCFDLTCSGFVQTSTQVALGSVIRPVSSESGQQYAINVGMFLDESGNWWLKVLHNVPIGYWPAELFGSLKHRATLVEWGGQVFSSKVKRSSPHTGTGMGSGDFANGKGGHACFMLNVRIKDYSIQLKYPENVTAATEEPNCYNVLNDVEQGTGPVFYFGGPGRRPPYCP